VLEVHPQVVVEGATAGGIVDKRQAGSYPGHGVIVETLHVPARLPFATALRLPVIPLDELTNSGADFGDLNENLFVPDPTPRLTSQELVVPSSDHS
jgi:hypothetical protein